MENEGNNYNIMSSSIFRKKILSQLSSPDQLDSMIAIERPRHWLIGIVLMIVCIAVGTWSVTGKITDRLDSNGILITTGAVIADVLTAYDGQVEAILVNVGQEITEGQDIAILQQRDIPERIATVEANLKDNRELLEEVETQISETEAESGQSDVERERRLNEQLERTRQDIARMKTQLEEREILFEQNVITRSQLEQARQTYQNKLSEENQILDALDNVSRQASAAEQNNIQRLGQLRLQVSGLENQLAELRTRQEKGLIVKATSNGTVTEIKTRIGAILGTGRPILSIETSAEDINGDDFTFLNFVSPIEGKKVQVGQDALVTLSSADPNDYGKVKGVVTSISAFPVSLENVISKLANETLARSLFERGAPYEVTIQLSMNEELRDSQAVENKFEWTAAKGNVVNVSSGTYAKGEIIYQVRSPITLFIPILRQWLKL